MFKLFSCNSWYVSHAFNFNKKEKKSICTKPVEWLNDAITMWPILCRVYR